MYNEIEQFLIQTKDYLVKMVILIILIFQILLFAKVKKQLKNQEFLKPQTN